MRLILCDDHLMLVEALAVVLAARGHDVLAVTSTPDSAVAAVRAQEPDICLLDLSFHGERTGLDAARAIFAMRNRTRVVVLSGVCDPDTLSEAVELPLAGFIRKDQNVDEIAGALEVIAAGGILIAPTLRRARPSRGAKPRPPGPMDQLTAREHEIVSRIVNGESTKHMAAAMRITPDTVRSYVKNVLAKLGLHSRLQIAAMASRSHHLAAGEPANPANGGRRMR
jgi:two-component system nitrate/nitrite response regulator NarL